MEPIYVAKKVWDNASAFMTMSCGVISVHGKVVDGFRHYDGPEVKNIMIVPDNLIPEIVKRHSWNAPMSDELENFCSKAWEKAQQKCRWFAD